MKYEELKKLVLELKLNDLDLSNEDIQEVRQIALIFRTLSAQFYEMSQNENSKRLLKEKPWLERDKVKN